MTNQLISQILRNCHFQGSRQDDRIGVHRPPAVQRALPLLLPHQPRQVHQLPGGGAGVQLAGGGAAVHVDGGYHVGGW